MGTVTAQAKPRKWPTLAWVILSPLVALLAAWAVTHAHPYPHTYDGRLIGRRNGPYIHETPQQMAQNIADATRLCGSAPSNRQAWAALNFVNSQSSTCRASHLGWAAQSSFDAAILSFYALGLLALAASLRFIPRRLAEALGTMAMVVVPAPLILLGLTLAYTLGEATYFPSGPRLAIDIFSALIGLAVILGIAGRLRPSKETETAKKWL